MPWRGAEVEVSWLAAPSLPLAGVPAAHQTRDPVAVVQSIMGIGFFQTTSKFRLFAESACPALRAEPNAVSAAIRMWCEWTRMADANAVTRWRVEDAAFEVDRIAAHVGAPIDRLLRAIEQTPQDVNHRNRAKELDFANVRGELWSEFEAAAARFGYEVTR